MEAKREYSLFSGTLLALPLERSIEQLRALSQTKDGSKASLVQIHKELTDLVKSLYAKHVAVQNGTSKQGGTRLAEVGHRCVTLALCAVKQPTFPIYMLLSPSDKIPLMVQQWIVSLATDSEAQCTTLLTCLRQRWRLAMALTPTKVLTSQHNSRLAGQTFGTPAVPIECEMSHSSVRQAVEELTTYARNLNTASTVDTSTASMRVPSVDVGDTVLQEALQGGSAKVAVVTDPVAIPAACVGCRLLYEIGRYYFLSNGFGDAAVFFDQALELYEHALASNMFEIHQEALTTLGLSPPALHALEGFSGLAKGHVRQGLPALRTQLLETGDDSWLHMIQGGASNTSTSHSRQAGGTCTHAAEPRAKVAKATFSSASDIDNVHLKPLLTYLNTPTEYSSKPPSISESAGSDEQVLIHLANLVHAVSTTIDGPSDEQSQQHDLAMKLVNVLENDASSTLGCSSLVHVTSSIVLHMLAYVCLVALEATIPPSHYWPSALQPESLSLGCLSDGSAGFVHINQVLEGVLVLLVDQCPNVKTLCFASLVASDHFQRPREALQHILNAMQIALKTSQFDSEMLHRASALLVSLQKPVLAAALLQYTHTVPYEKIFQLLQQHFSQSSHIESIFLQAHGRLFRDVNVQEWISHFFSQTRKVSFQTVDDGIWCGASSHEQLEQLLTTVQRVC
eukprot:m.92312 g.92312  ORF g.92312 m.92312 type:complete len:680 (+) comp12986_c0_seq1:115-2154(+)